MDELIFLSFYRDLNGLTQFDSFSGSCLVLGHDLFPVMICGGHDPPTGNPLIGVLFKIHFAAFN